MAGIKTPIRIMNKSDRKFAIAAMLCGIATALVSCYYEAGEIETTEQEVVFSAATQYENLPETRTIYSGQYFDISGNHRERIDWVAGTDKIKILNGNTGDVAIYTVGTPSASNERSVADVTADASRLTWSTDGNPNTFYAVYPSTASVVAASHTFSGTIVADQSAQTESHTGVTLPGSTTGGTYTNPVMSEQAFMVAKVQASSGSNVTLPFYPAMTAFEFNVVIANDGGTDATITSFDMSSTHDALTGSWSWDGSTFTCPARSAGNNDKITVNFTGGRTISASNPLKFTVFALPQNLTEVKLTFHLTSGDKTLSLKTGGVWDTFQACKKYRITTPGLPTDGEWIYIIEEIDDIVTYGHEAVDLGFNVTSYRVRETNGVRDYSTVQAVSWKAQYWDGSAWQDWTSIQNEFTINSSQYTGVGVNSTSAYESRSAHLIANTHTTPVQQSSRDILRNRTAVSNYDLSTHDIFGNSNTQTTANCYVVTAPGTYKFPCVYGNAITNGTTNYESFAPGRSGSSISSIYTTYVSTYFDQNGGTPLYQYPDVNYTPALRNAINTEIQNPYVIEDINSNSGYGVSGQNVAIVWQDEQMLTASDLSLITENGHQYIQFNLSSANIQPGNIVIALRGAAGGSFTDTKTILWSWHIWVTERDLTPIDGYMSANLGWNKKEEGYDKYTDRTIPVRLIQIAPNDDLSAAIDNEEFTMTQIGDSGNIGENVGWNPYYQWGRKDPMIPGIYDASASNIVGEPCKDKTIYPGPDYTGMNSYVTLVTTKFNLQAEADYGTAIRNPHVPYIADNSGDITYNAGLDGSTSWIAGYIPSWLYLQAPNAGGTGAGFAWHRSKTAIPYNLWNSYCFSSNDWTGANKYKTVYDPCPPGFTVPSRDFSTALGTGSDAPDHSGKNFTLSNGSVLFMPYTGARIFYNLHPSGNNQPVTPGLYLRHVAGAANEFGMYWTDCPTNIVGSHPGLANWGSYSDFMYSKMFLFVPTNNVVQNYTKGTAGSIRPVVDPKYTQPTISNISNGGEL